MAVNIVSKIIVVLCRIYYCSIYHFIVYIKYSTCHVIMLVYLCLHCWTSNRRPILRYYWVWDPKCCLSLPLLIATATQLSHQCIWRSWKVLKNKTFFWWLETAGKHYTWKKKQDCCDDRLPVQSFFCEVSISPIRLVALSPKESSNLNDHIGHLAFVPTFWYVLLECLLKFRPCSGRRTGPSSS